MPTLPTTVGSLAHSDRAAYQSALCRRAVQPLVGGLFNEVVVRDDTAKELFPHIVPISYDEAVLRALDRNVSKGAETTWFDVDVKTLPGEFAGSAPGMLIDRRERTTAAPPSDVFGVFSNEPR